MRRSNERVLNLLLCLPISDIFAFGEGVDAIPITLILFLFAYMKFSVRSEAFVIIETSIFLNV